MVYERKSGRNIGKFAKKMHLCTMNWIEQVTILDLLVKGFVVGVVVSAPLGPVGVLCIQRTLNKGRWYGFVTGLGAALSDICYALLTGYGMSFMDEFLTRNQILLQIVGSVMLFVFGVYTFRSNPVQSIRPVSSTPGTYLHNFVTAFFVTLSNPLIIFLFIGLFARVSFVMPGSPLGFQLVGYWAIIAGAVTWWLLLTYFVNKVRTQFNLRGIWVLNRIIGVLVMVMSVVGVVMAATGKSLY
jgi:threonine/homoserine/homoserine lactone efflux protein